MKPTHQITEFLAGRISHIELCPAAQSAVRFNIYQRAAALLKLDRADMKQAASQLPEEVRDLVRVECRRLIELRK